MFVICALVMFVCFVWCVVDTVWFGVLWLLLDWLFGLVVIGE